MDNGPRIVLKEFDKIKAYENIERVIINEEMLLVFSKIMNSQYEHLGFFCSKQLKGRSY